MSVSKHNYSRTGWGFIILSVACVVVFLIDYRSQFIFHLTSISELGTILAGTSGIFASLASLFFVLENLELQRHTIEQQQMSIDLQREELKNQIFEMKESNEYFKEQNSTLKQQASESTFFQLVENHRNLIQSLTIYDTQGYQGLNKFYTDLKQRTSEYYRIAYTGDVSNPRKAQFYPIRSLAPQIENIEQIFSDTLTIISFISQKLENHLFYHHIFYNSLSKAEKYILGMYIVNEKVDQTEHFHIQQHNYLAEFQGSGNAYFDKNTIPFFPYLSFEFTKTNFEFLLPEAIYGYEWEQTGQLEIKVIKNEHDKPVMIHEVILQYNWYKKDYVINIPVNIQFSDNCFVDISSVFNKHITLKYIQRTNHEHSYQQGEYSSFSFYFELTFRVEYNGKPYKYKTRWRFQDYSSGETRTVQIISQDK